MSELELLIDVLNNQTESEADGVKYIYMDESTVYRFENNKMKKVSASMLKRARKSIETLNKQQSKQKKPVKPKQQPVEEESEALSRYGEEIDEQEQIDEVEEPIEEPKPIKKQIKREPSRKPINETQQQNIDLSEYWQTKARLEYQEQELNRYKSKVDKLKHYKSIVNRLTGGEYDSSNEYVQPVQQQQQPTSKRNDSLFLF